MTNVTKSGQARLRKRQSSFIEGFSFRSSICCLWEKVFLHQCFIKNVIIVYLKVMFSKSFVVLQQFKSTLQQEQKYRNSGCLPDAYLYKTIKRTPKYQIDVQGPPNNRLSSQKKVCKKNKQIRKMFYLRNIFAYSFRADEQTVQLSALVVFFTIFHLNIFFHDRAFFGRKVFTSLDVQVLFFFVKFIDNVKKCYGKNILQKNSNIDSAKGKVKWSLQLLILSF